VLTKRQQINLLEAIFFMFYKQLSEQAGCLFLKIKINLFLNKTCKKFKLFDEVATNKDEFQRGSANLRVQALENSRPMMNLAFQSAS